MTEFFSQYPYLTACLLGVLLYGIVYAAAPNQRQSMVLSSLLATPQALMSLAMIPAYWQPRRIAVVGIGPEDVMFCFLTGGLSWVFAVSLLPNAVTFSIKYPLAIKRYALHLASMMVIIGVIYLNGERTMSGPLLAMLAWGGLLLLIYRPLWSIAVSGALISTALYTAFFKLVTVIWPDFTSLWTAENLLGMSLWSIPLEEVLWACLYGAVWPVTVAYVLDARWAPAVAVGH